MTAISIIWLAGSALAAAVVFASIARTRGTRDLQAALLIGVAASLVVALWSGEREVESRQAQLREMVAGMAPTYAQEMTRHEHASIGPDTPPDDPDYLYLIDMQRSWLAVNPAVADIYTLRRMADGRVALIVESETDYDRDGRYEGDREVPYSDRRGLRRRRSRDAGGPRR
jgi:PAS domain-containing protein